MAFMANMKNRNSDSRNMRFSLLQSLNFAPVIISDFLPLVNQTRCSPTEKKLFEKVPGKMSITRGVSGFTQKKHFTMSDKISFQITFFFSKLPVTILVAVKIIYCYEKLTSVQLQLLFYNTLWWSTIEKYYSLSANDSMS